MVPRQWSTDLGKDDVGGDDIDTGQSTKPRNQVRMWLRQLADPQIHQRDTPVKMIQFLEQLTEQPSQVIAVTAFQRQLEFLARARDTAGCTGSQIPRCRFAGDNGIQDRPAALADNIAQHQLSLMLAVSNNRMMRLTTRLRSPCR